MIDPSTVDFDKGNGLVPAIVQDAETEQVLMLAYMDHAALQETVDSGEATFFSRSRGGRWRKGETSGNRLRVVSITADCDGDSLLVRAKAAGHACHLQRTSCFGLADAPGLGRLARLEQVIRARVGADPETSWTSRLLTQGPARIAQKVGEEAVETALAAVVGSDEDLTSEAADLIYHLLVLLHSRGLALATVLVALETRAHQGQGTSAGRS